MERNIKKAATMDQTFLNLNCLVLANLYVPWLF